MEYGSFGIKGAFILEIWEQIAFLIEILNSDSFILLSDELLFEYLPEYRVAICTECRYAV